MITSSDLEIIFVYYIEIVDAALNCICLFSSLTSPLDHIQYGSIITKKSFTKSYYQVWCPPPFSPCIWCLIHDWRTCLYYVSSITTAYYSINIVLLFFLLGQGSPTVGLCLSSHRTIPSPPATSPPSQKGIRYPTQVYDTCKADTTWT